MLLEEDVECQYLGTIAPHIKMEGNPMTDVFISYSRKDSDFIRRLNDALVKTNLKVWVDWEDIARGEDWWSAIQEGVEKADTALIVVSENWLSSEVCHRELEYVRQHEKRVFPIIRQQIRGEVELRSKGSWIDQNWEMRARDNWKFLRALNWTSFDDDTQFDTSFAALLKALEEDQPYIKAHTRYQTRGLEWERSKRNPGFLLAGDDLTFAEKWLADGVNLQPPATDLVRTYIAMSKANEDARQSREALREQSIKQFRRAAIGLVAVVILAVIAALITGVSAIDNRNKNATANAQMDSAATGFQVQKSTAEVAFSAATSVALDAATLSSSQSTAQVALTDVHDDLIAVGGTLTAIATIQTESAAQQDIYLQLARGLLQVVHKDTDAVKAQAAVDIADAILRDHWDIPFAFVASAIIKERAGYMEQAMEVYSLAIAMFPNYIDAYNYRAINYENQEEWALAIRDYDAIIQINEDSVNLDPLYYFYRGLDYIQLKDYQASFNDFDKAISLNANYTNAYYWRGLAAYMGLGDFQNAFNDFDKAISLNANYTNAYYWRGLAAYMERSDSLALVNDWNTYLDLGGELDEADQSLLTDGEAKATQPAMPTFTQTPP